MEKPDFSVENSTYDAEKRFQEAVQILDVVFSIKNLSNIELSHLRRITNEVVKQAERDNPSSDLAIVNPPEEITQRFLLELYGVDYHYIQEHSKTEEDVNGFIEYIRKVRERAHLI